MRKRVHIADIAEQRNIPPKYLEQILLQLKKGGFIESKKGPNGGYQLSRPPHTITISAIVRLLDNSFPGNMPAKGETRSLVAENADNSFYGVFTDVYDAAFKVMDVITFDAIQKKEADVSALESMVIHYDI